MARLVKFPVLADASKVRRITTLLRETELSMRDIAQRMGVSHSAVVNVNKMHSVRDYRGGKFTWVTNS